MKIPQDVSESVRKRNPHLYQVLQKAGNEGWKLLPPDVQTKRIRQSIKPLLNKLEQRYFDYLCLCGFKPMKQAVTLRLDPPFKRYTPDLAFVSPIHGLVLIETKGPHRFREKGIAKAALAAKTYPQFRFELVEWTSGEWKISLLSP